MLVFQLIEQLQACPPAATVVLPGCDHSYHRAVFGGMVKADEVSPGEMYEHDETSAPFGKLIDAVVLI